MVTCVVVIFMSIYIEHMTPIDTHKYIVVLLLYFC